MKSLRNQGRVAGGFTIVEMMVAITLGLLLIAGVLQVFLGNRQTQKTEQAVSRMEESGRIALDLMAQDLRAAGYYGCSKPLPDERAVYAVMNNGNNPTIVSHVANSTWYDNFSNSSAGTAVIGYTRDTSGNWSPNTMANDLGATVAGDVMANARKGSDVLAVFTATRNSATVSTAFNHGTSSLVVNPGQAALSTGTKMLIGNCNTADVFVITDKTVGAGTVSLVHDTSATLGGTNKDNTLDGDYSVGTPLYVFSQKIYYIRDTGRVSPGNPGQPVYSLYVNDGLSTQELVEGVEYMHILYGQNIAPPDSTPVIQFVPASSLVRDPGTGAANVISVRIALLTQSTDAVRDTADANSYQLLDLTIGPATAVAHDGGRSLRRVFTTTVELRNMEY